MLASVVLTGCELRTEVNLDITDDGTGTLEVGVGVDDDILDRQPELLENLAVDDLLDAGWELNGPAREDDDLTWVRLRHPVTAPADVGPLVEQVAGEDGPFRDFVLERDDAFARTEYTFSGVVDFSGGAAGLVEDPELADALDAEPIELLEAQVGSAVDQLIGVQVAVRLPGDVDSNAPTQASNGAIWRPSVLERDAIELSATGTLTRTERWVWVAVAAAAGGALVLFAVVRVAIWRRRRLAGSG